MKKITILITGFTFLFQIVNSVYAQVNLPPGVLEEEIRIPTFISIDTSFVDSATVFSWIAFIGALLTILLVVFWVFLIIRASIKVMQSDGDPEGVAEGSKRFRAIFAGVVLTFLVPVILSLIGIFIGIGSIFQWPKMFSECYALSEDGSKQYSYYYQVFLEEGESIASSKCSGGSGDKTQDPKTPGALN